MLLDGHGGRQGHGVGPLLALLLPAALHARRAGLGQGAAGQALVPDPLRATGGEGRFSEEFLTDGGDPPGCKHTHLLHCLVLRRGGAVVRVLLRRHGHLPALPHVSALLVLVGQLLHVAVRLPAAEAAHGAGQPLPQSVPYGGGGRGEGTKG